MACLAILLIVALVPVELRLRRERIRRRNEIDAFMEWGDFEKIDAPTTPKR